jgi:hypothetical protein
MGSLTDNLEAMVDIGMVLTIGIAFAGLAVIAYIIWTLRDMLLPDDPGATTSAAYNQTHAQIGNITSGFDSAIALILVAVTIFILAIAISALLMLRGR